MTATHHAIIKTIGHPALAVNFCDNCGTRLWGETTCRECGHTKKPARCGDTEPAGNGSIGSKTTQAQA